MIVPGEIFSIAYYGNLDCETDIFLGNYPNLATDFHALLRNYTRLMFTKRASWDAKSPSLNKKSPMHF
jgi:hypothetical protein